MHWVLYIALLFPVFNSLQDSYKHDRHLTTNMFQIIIIAIYITVVDLLLENLWQVDESTGQGKINAALCIQTCPNVKGKKIPGRVTWVKCCTKNTMISRSCLLQQIFNLLTMLLNTMQWSPHLWINIWLFATLLHSVQWKLQIVKPWHLESNASSN